jgi:ornithine cyclodeaminase/alanine dehydrogenase-like protein (mu-crystallin family)
MPSESEILVLSAADVRSLLDVDAAITSQQTAFEALGRGEALLPARLLVDGAEGSVSFCYAARLAPTEGAVCKFGSVNPSNAARGVPTISAVITVLDGADGRPVALMDGTTVTTIRTSAASAVAIRALAAAGAGTLAVLGTGVQADAHVRAVSRVLDLDSVRVWGRDQGRSRSLAADLDSELDVEVTAAATAREAVQGADVVVACTTSSEPVLETAWLGPGATVVSIGSFAANRSEVPPDLLTRAAALVVDDVDTALEHAGPIVQGIASGLIEADQLTTLGEVVTGAKAGRTQPSEVVFYNSVGIGVQDAAAAIAVMDAARVAGRGQRVTL